MSNGERDPWYAYQDRQEKTYTQAELDAAVAAERERCAKIVEPGALEPWEARCGVEGIALMRDLAAAIRAGAFTPEFMQAQADEAPDLARGA